LSRKEVTLKHIADITGYSITTVSHVINKTRHVDKNTREKILKAIDELQYIIPEDKSRTSTDPRSKRTIGIIIADIREDFFAEIVKAIEMSCAENDYHLILCDSEDDEEKEKFYLGSLIKRGVAGLVLFPINSHEAFTPRIPPDMPTIIIDRKLEDGIYDYVGIDNFASAYEATKLVLRYGSERIGFIGYDDKIYTSKERARGYTSAMIERGLGQQADILRIEYHGENSIDRIRDFLTKGKAHKNGLICATSNICFDAVSAIQELKLSIPEDIILVSYDDNKWFDCLRYPISVVRQPTTEMGIVAVEQLVAKIEQPQKKKILGKTILLPYEIIDRLGQ
jgi:LacI family transcriptional regulator